MFSIPFLSRSFLTNYTSSVLFNLMLPYVGVEIYFRPKAEAREIWQATMIHIAQEGGWFVLSTNQFCRKGRLSAVNRMYFWRFIWWYVCQYKQMYCTWCYYIIIQLGPFWLNLITKGTPHLKQSCPLLMFPPNLLGIWAKLGFSGNGHSHFHRLSIFNKLGSFIPNLIKSYVVILAS